MNSQYDILCISPHQDDIALSTTWLLKEIIKKNNSIKLKLLSCFTITNFAPELETTNIDIISRQRYKEDLSYTKKLSKNNFTVECVGLYDSPLREEWDKKNNILEPANYYKENIIEIEKYTLQLIECFKEKSNLNSLVVAPIGLMHKDHIIASNASTYVFKNSPILFYLDIPYGFEVSNEETINRVKTVEKFINKELTLINSLDEFLLDEWLNILMSYKSQFSCNDIVAIGNKILINQGERFWACNRAIELLNKFSVKFK